MGDLVSTNFSLVETGSADLEICERSAQFDIAMNIESEYGRAAFDLEGLTADQVVDAALKMLNVILYSYPEKMSEIVYKLGKLRF